MSEHNYFHLAVEYDRKQHPEHYKVSTPAEFDAKIAQTLKDCRTLAAANTAARTDPRQELRKEYNRLFSDLFNLKENAQGCEIRVNESAGQIRNDEQRLNSLLTEKAKMDSPKGLRNIERSIVQLEGEIAEEKQKYNRLRTENLNAVKALKEFDTEQLVALKAELDAPLPKV